MYQFEVTSGKNKAYWMIDLTKKEGVLKKQKGAKATTTVCITDENILHLYKGKLLLEELKIQERIKFQ